MITSVSQEHKVMRHCWKTSNAALCALKNVNALWYSLSFFCRRGFGKEAKMPQQFAQNPLFECYNLPSRGNHVPGSKSFGKVRPSWDKMRRRWRCANAFGFTEKKCQGLLKWSPFTSSTPGIRNVVPFSSFLLWLLRHVKQWPGEGRRIFITEGVCLSNCILFNRALYAFKFLIARNCWRMVNCAFCSRHNCITKNTSLPASTHSTHNSNKPT